MAEIIYYVNDLDNNYIDVDNNYFIAKGKLTESPTKLHYIKYKPYFYNNDSFKGYIAFIRKSDGSYLKLKPYIYTNIQTAISGLAIAGVSRSGDNVI